MTEIDKQTVRIIITELDHLSKEAEYLTGSIKDLKDFIGKLK